MKPIKPLAALLSLSLICLLVPGEARARDLSGTIALDSGLTLVLEQKEGFFSEMLRAIRLRSSPRPRLDLTTLGSSGDRLFIGTDLNLYCEKATESGYKAEETYKVGSAMRLWDIKTGPGIKLAEVQSVTGHVEGDNRTRLKVETGESQKKPADVERAGFRFWRDEIVYQYDNPTRRKGKLDNFTVIVRAVLDALPEQADDAQTRFDNFNQLVRFVREAKDSNLVPFRDLLRQKLARVRERVSQGKLPSEKTTSVVKGYEDLQSEVDKRTEDL
ncbi:MAG: hypothetical protein HY815_25480 [Candidatus Riflebacteria bacterium]|nr:hypothetical protein [Candidatus Riflebacteria bacterium]